jgi:hypothetical protein
MFRALFYHDLNGLCQSRLAEDTAAAKAFSLQQTEEEKACRSVPLALKHLLCAAKIV